MILGMQRSSGIFSKLSGTGGKLGQFIRKCSQTPSSITSLQSLQVFATVFQGNEYFRFSLIIAVALLTLILSRVYFSMVTIEFLYLQ